MFFFSLLTLLVSTASLAATSDEESKRLIQSYVSAADSGDLALIKTFWTDLNDHPDAVAYMSRNYPQINYLFEVRGLYFQMDKIESQYSQDLKGAPLAAPSALELQKNTIHAPNEVNQFSLSESEADPRPANGEIVARNPNSGGRTNQDVALGNPNQNRLSNETLIRNRMQAFYDQKFQQAPQTLVPGTTGVSEEAPSP